MQSLVDTDPDGALEVTRWLQSHFSELVRRESLPLLRFEGRDAASRQPVALTVMRGLSPSLLLQLRAVTAIHQRLDHSGLRPMTLLSMARDIAVLVVPRIEGPTLADLLLEGPLPVARAVAVATAIAEALGALHGAGLVHGDVCPQNVIVGEGVVQLLHFGMRPHELYGRCVDHPAVLASMRYKAPEHVGLLRVDLGPESDLYSLGAVLYETLTGRPAFRGDTVRALLGSIATSAVPLHDIGGSLALVLGRLLARDPRHRYHTSRGLVSDLQSLQERATDALFVPGTQDVRPLLTTPAFVGRARELASLCELVSSEGVHLGLLESPSGGGKSRLLEQVIAYARTRVELVVTVHGRRAETPAPFDMMRHVARALLEARPLLLAEFVEREDVDALRALVPEAWRESAPLAPNRESRDARVVAALERLIAIALESVDGLLLILDDCQWADPATLTFVERWHGQVFPRTAGLIAAFRSEEVEAAHPLRRIHAGLHVHLPPLTEDEVFAVMTSMAGPLPSSLQPLAAEAGGNPFAAVEGLRGLVEAGRLNLDVATRRLQGTSQWLSSSSGAAVLVERLDRLPAPVRAVLDAAAILGRRFDLDLVCRLLPDMDATSVIASLDDGRRLFLVTHHSGAGQYTFTHDRVREGLLAGLDDAARVRLHRAATQYFLSAGEEDPYALSYHLAGAGDAAAALPYALRAAEDARARFEPHLAERLFRLAREGFDTETPARARQRVLEGLGEVLLLAGRYDEAEQHLQASLTYAIGAIDRGRLLGYLAQICHKTGRIAQAHAHVVDGLTLLGHSVPRKGVPMAFALLCALGRQAAHTLWPRWFVGRRPVEEAASDLTASPLFETLLHVGVNQSHMPTILWTHISHLNTMERYAPTRELGWVSIEHGGVMAQIPWFSRAVRYTRRGMALPETQRNVLQRVKGFARAAYLEFGMGNVRRCLEMADSGLTLSADVADHWEFNAARVYQARALFLLGHPAKAAAIARDVYEQLREDRQYQVGLAALGDWVRNVGGQVEEAQLAPLPPDADPLARAEVFTVRAYWHLGQGRPAEAAACFRDALDSTGGNEPLHQYACRAAWEARAWRLAASALPVGAGDVREALRQRARKAAAGALRLARRSLVDLPHALTEAAIMAAEFGLPKRARRLFAEAIRRAVEQENLYHFAWAVYERGRVGAALGWAGAERNVEDACWAFERMGFDPSPMAAFRLPVLRAEPTPVLPALVDRFVGSVDAGRRIVSSLDADLVMAAVREGASEVLRPQRCEVMRAGDSAEAQGVAEALRQREVVVEARSLSVPLIARGRAVACLHAEHEVAGYFQDEERLLGAYLGALGGTALENAEGFATVASLSASLEARGVHLRDSLDEVEVMLKEIHHRVNNNLQLVVSLLSLQSARVPDEDVRLPLDSLSQRIRLMAVIHQTTYSRNLRGGVRLDHLLRTVVEHVASTFADTGSRIRLTLDFEEMLVPLLAAVDWALIVSELVSNALQHAFPEIRKGSVRVRMLRVDSGSPLLVVADDGVGLPPDHAGRGIGLILVNRLATRRGGQVAIEGAQGTTVRLTGHA